MQRKSIRTVSKFWGVTFVVEDRLNMGALIAIIYVPPELMFLVSVRVAENSSGHVCGL